MGLFSKKPVKNNLLLKLYKFVTQDEAENFDNKPLIDFFLTEFEALNLKLDDFYITGPYPNDGWKTKRGFLNGLKRKDYKNVHHLMISDQENDLILSFGNWSHNITMPIDFGMITMELMISEGRITSEKLKDFANKLTAVLDFEYGFIFKQSEKYDLDEGKIVRNFFSQTSKQNPDYARWSKYKAAMKDGFIRKIYKTNFLSEKCLNNPLVNSLIKDHNLGQLSNLGDYYLWEMSNKEFAKAEELSMNSEYVIENIEFDQTKTKTEIDEDIDKYAYKPNV